MALSKSENLLSTIAIAVDGKQLKILVSYVRRIGLILTALTATVPRYLDDHVTPAIEVTSRHRLRSANRHRLIVPRCRLNTYGRRAFRLLVRRSGAHCQMNSEIWRVMSTASNCSLKQSCSASATSACIREINVMRCINLGFTYLLTCIVCGSADGGGEGEYDT